MPARLTAIFLLIAIASLAGQDQPSPSGSNQPTFRSAANYVRVDMYATQDGQSVEDLKAEEIDLLEDGAIQKIEAFEHVKVRPAGSQDSRVEPDGVSNSRQMAADARARVFVIFLDTYHTQIEGSANMRLPLVRFLDRALGPDDLVAVMTPEMAASDIAFGRKTVVISNIMQTEWTWGRRGRINDQDPKEELYDTCYGGTNRAATELKARRREKLTLDALEDLIVHLGGIREERKAVLTVTEGWRLFRQDQSLAASRDDQRVSPGDALLRRPRRQPEDGGSLQGSNRIECETDRVALAALDHTLRLREITESANRGNVTFYPIYARGLQSFDAPIGPEKPPPPAQDAANLSARQDSLRFIADSTDGTSVINTNNIDGAIRRIVDDLSSYYLLSYYSTNTKLDGRFRNITVRVKRSGVRVRARRGYRGATAEQLLSSAPGRGSSAPSVATSALDTGVSINARASFRIRASSWVKPGGGTFWVVGELDYRTRKELAWTAGAKADVVVLGADGAEVLSRTLSVPASQGSFALRVPESGEVPPGEYAVRVRLRPDADAQLSLSDTARVAVRSDGAVLGDAVLWRRGPSTGPQHLRTADPRFQRSDRIRLELATAAPSAPSARMLDRAGRPLQIPVQVTLRPSEEGDFQWIVADAALAPLAAGDYAIEVADRGAKQVTPFRVVP